MSASLVGSEMCIRDRLIETMPADDSGRPQGCSIRAGVVAAGAELDYAEPVSYTHLTLPTICSV
eukprot:11240607-Alexandrium_andersonii.AAC.1